MTKEKKITAAQMMLMGEIITQECEKGIQLKENKRRFIEVAAKLCKALRKNLCKLINCDKNDNIMRAAK